MQVKFVLLVLLTGYHFYCRSIIVKLEKDKTLTLPLPIPAVQQSSGAEKRAERLICRGGHGRFYGLLCLGAKLYKQARMKNAGKA